MKKTISTLLILLCSMYVMAQKQTSYTVTESNNTHTLIEIKVGDLKQNSVTTPLGKAQIVTVDKGTSLLQKGAPNLPKLIFSLLIPNQKNSQIEILESHYTEYQDIAIAPSKGKILRTINPADIPYTYSDIYQTNAFFTEWHSSWEAKPYESDQ